MDTITCIKERRSIRSFTEEAVTDEVVKEIVEAAAFAPSWKNTQITRYNLVRDPELLKKIGEEGCMGFAGNNAIISGTKALIVVSYVDARSGFERDGSYSTSKGEQWQMFDAGIATQTFCLAAWEKGVGSVIMGIFDDKKVAEIIELPENETVAALVAIGYPKMVPAAPKRKSVEQLLRGASL